MVFIGLMLVVVVVITTAIASTARVASIQHGRSQIGFALQPLLNLPPMDAVFAGGRPLVAFAIAIIAIRVEHLQLEVGRENATRTHFCGVARMQLGCGGGRGVGGGGCLWLGMEGRMIEVMMMVSHHVFRCDFALPLDEHC